MMMIWLFAAVALYVTFRLGQWGWAYRTRSRHVHRWWLTDATAWGHRDDEKKWRADYTTLTWVCVDDQTHVTTTQVPGDQRTTTAQAIFTRQHDSAVREDIPEAFLRAFEKQG